MPWSEETNAALRRWLRSETWFTRQPADHHWFHVFVAHVWNERREVWDEDSARIAILATAREMHPERDERRLEDRLIPFCDEGALLLEFLASLADYGSFALPVR
jgi:hypothetical protein